MRRKYRSMRHRSPSLRTVDCERCRRMIQWHLSGRKLPRDIVLGTYALTSGVHTMCISLLNRWISANKDLHLLKHVADMSSLGTCSCPGTPYPRHKVFQTANTFSLKGLKKVRCAQPKATPPFCCLRLSARWNVYKSTLSTREQRQQAATRRPRESTAQ